MKREWLIHSRKLQGLTQDVVAVNVGISRTYYTQIELGERNPSGLVALKLSKLLKIDMSDFYA